MARRCSTICLPVGKDTYLSFIDSPAAFRSWLDGAFRDLPELFPQGFARGYTLKDSRRSVKRGLRLRRIRCKATGQTFSVRPCFALPYMTGWADDVEGPLFLRGFGVPFWALARVFGQGPMYWYRLELSLGSNSIVGTTVRRAPLPEHLLADEHHQPRDGVKNYVATTVAEGCCLGAALAPSAGGCFGHAGGRQFPQLLVHQRQQLPGGVGVALCEARQDAGYFVHRRSPGCTSLVQKGAVDSLPQRLLMSLPPAWSEILDLFGTPVVIELVPQTL